MESYQLETPRAGCGQQGESDPAAQTRSRRNHGFLAPAFREGFVKFLLKFCDGAVEGENLMRERMLLGQESGPLDSRAIIHIPGRKKGHLGRSDFRTLSWSQPGR